MLDKIKLLLGIPDDSKNRLLEQLITICSDEFKDLTHQNELIESIIVKMVCWRYNSLGTDGLTREGYDGMTFMYANDYPTDLYKLIIGYRKVRIPQ